MNLSLDALIEFLQVRDVRLTDNGSWLGVTSPAGLLTHKMRRIFTEHAQQILAAMRRHESALIHVEPPAPSDAERRASALLARVDDAAVRSDLRSAYEEAAETADSEHGLAMMHVVAQRRGVALSAIHPDEAQGPRLDRRRKRFELAMQSAAQPVQ